MLRVTIDGNTAAAHIAYQCNDTSFIYPITPSSGMAELCDRWASTSTPNAFGNAHSVLQMQSEAGAAGAMHGALSAGSLSTTFTASQGLLLMIPNMYKIAGEHLPNVIYVASRSIASHALNIFCDHSDVYACLKTGYNVICCDSVQEVNDLCLVANIATLKTTLPFIVFFDGFRTSHELATIEQFTCEEIRSLLPYDHIDAFRSRCLSSASPMVKGTAQNADVFFQNKIATDTYTTVLSDVDLAMAKVGAVCGTRYHSIDYVGDTDAEHIIVIMGSATSSAIAASHYVAAKTGVMTIRVLAPFDYARFAKILPKTAKTITVLERNHSPNTPNILYSCVRDCVDICVLRGVYGLGGKEFTPDMAIAVYDNASGERKDRFSIGITDDVGHTSLAYTASYHETDNTCMRVYGLGSDGSTSASKTLGKLLSKWNNGYSQGYFEYDSKKSGSITTSHIRSSARLITASYNATSLDYVLINSPHLVTRVNYVQHMKPNSTLILNAGRDFFLTPILKKELISKKIRLYTIDAGDIARRYGLGNKVNNIMLSAFIGVSGDAGYDISDLSRVVSASLSSKGQDIIARNEGAIKSALDSVFAVDLLDIPEVDTVAADYYDEFYRSIIRPINHGAGNDIPVSAFTFDGSMPTDTTRYEKRGIADRLPCWNSEKCVQCNLCALSCPHNAITPKIFSTPTELPTSKAYMADGAYRLQVSPLDCTGCGVCSQVCPVRGKAITMVDAADILEQEVAHFDTFDSAISQNTFDPYTVKGSQFCQSYFSYSGACAGCGETPYIRLVTQLYGDRMIIANATGCSSIYAASYPSCPYRKDSQGFGPAWSNSLFEDNAEYGLGIARGKEVARANYIARLQSATLHPTTSDIVREYLSAPDDNTIAKECILALRDTQPDDTDSWVLDGCGLMQKNSVWIIGGDGWAYDIGYGGLDHIMASGQNVNILILDTELYSNTGGQMSKSSQRGSVSSFATSGKSAKKKDLPAIALTYRNVYVACISLGADPAQSIKAITEAESFDGVSIIFAYAPCINHGYDLSQSSAHMRLAVETGYFTLMRYDPRTTMHIDSTPTKDISELWTSENRYRRIMTSDPELAQRLMQKCSHDATERRKNYEKYLQS